MSNAVVDLESRMETDRSDWKLAHKVFQKINQTDVRPTGGGPICHLIDLPASSLLQLEARSLCRSGGRLSEHCKGLCQSPMVPGWASSQPSTSSGSLCNFGGSSLEKSNLVPSPSSKADRLPTAYSPRGIPFTEGDARK